MCDEKVQDAIDSADRIVLLFNSTSNAIVQDLPAKCRAAQYFHISAKVLAAFLLAIIACCQLPGHFDPFWETPRVESAPS